MKKQKTFSAGELLQIIKRYGAKCRGSVSARLHCQMKNCAFYSVCTMIEQPSLFTGTFREDWAAGALEIARAMPVDVYFSQVRNAIEDKYKSPDHKNIWGSVATRALRASGYLRTNDYKRSERPSAHGNRDYLWIRINGHKL